MAVREGGRCDAARAGGGLGPASVPTRRAATRSYHAFAASSTLSRLFVRLFATAKLYTSLSFAGLVLKPLRVCNARGNDSKRELTEF